MKSKSLYLIALASTVLVLAGCGSSDDDAAAKAEAEAKAAAAQAKSDAQHAELKSEMNKVQDAVANSTAEINAEVAKQLAAQKEELIAQFTSQNNELAKQVTSLESQYKKLEKVIPEDVAKQIQASLPDLKDTVKKLEDLVAKFDPQTIDQIKEFSSKYDKELGIAKDLVKSLLDQVQSGGLKLPSF
ncbi:MAG: hypothetical protein AAGB46_07935 [Verrucomicrobiota bacterium]